METNPVSRRYGTRSSTAESVAKSRVDWNRTKRYLLPESQDDEEEIPSSSSSSSSSSSEKDPKSRSKEDGEEEEEAAILSKSHGEAGSEGQDDQERDRMTEKGGSDVSSEDQEEANISFGKRKRLRTAVMYDSDGSSDSEVLSRGTAKGRRVVSEDDLSVSEESATSPEEKAATRKRERHLKMQEIAYRQSRKSGRVNQHDEGDVDHDLMQRDGHSPLTQEKIDVMSNEDSMKYFIDDDDEGGGGGDEEEEEEKKWKWGNFEEEVYQHQDRKHQVASNLLEKYIPFVADVDHYLHFQRVVKAFLINAMDDKFLSSLYARKRQKKYAQDMLTSLYYFDERFIQPYLESLVEGCRWKERYKRRVDSYSNVKIIRQRPEQHKCEACELDRVCKFIVTFSGGVYSPKTLEVDNFMPLNTQRMKVGIVCQRRTQVYHDLKNYKYKLYQKCCSAIKEHVRDEDGDENLQDEPVKDLVNRVFSYLEETGWIREEYSELESYQDEVAEFHKFLKEFKKEFSSGRFL